MLEAKTGGISNWPDGFRLYRDLIGDFGIEFADFSDQLFLLFADLMQSLSLLHKVRLDGRRFPIEEVESAA